MRTFMTVITVLAFAAMSSAAFAVVPNTDDFEVDTGSWSNVTRVASGTGGVTSAGGSYHATTTSTGSHFTNHGGYDNAWNGGFIVTVDVYFDPGWATTGGGFDLTQALNQTNTFGVASHVGDIVMVAGVDTATNSVLFGASQNTNGVGGGIGTGSTAFFRGGGGALAAPIEVFEFGWYTLKWDVHDTGGFVETSLSVIAPSSAVHAVHTWQFTGWTGSGSAPIATSGGWHTGTTNTVGGHRYMWLLNENPSGGGIAIDNATTAAQGAPIIPLPAAAWAGLGLLGAIGAGRTIRRR